jgi:altronate dehydratase
VLVVPTVICAAVVAERIAASIAPIGAALPHLAGCGQLGPDLTVTHDTLAAYARHPNVGAVIVVALGCEQVVAQRLHLAVPVAPIAADAVMDAKTLPQVKMPNRNGFVPQRFEDIPDERKRGCRQGVCP